MSNILHSDNYNLIDVYEIILYKYFDYNNQCYLWKIMKTNIHTYETLFKNSDLYKNPTLKDIKWNCWRSNIQHLVFNYDNIEECDEMYNYLSKLVKKTNIKNINKSLNSKRPIVWKKKS